ncbi:unnamed protein product [Heligmosomoides polygyrus]|uniref:Secreted protein n=1 Tax=Heligmosomoides polygyrus TaxID=6339 RepID=A0A183GSH0_HELPZ|nr:unnamed protein product [Heligmosomoides polygyrus]
MHFSPAVLTLLLVNVDAHWKWTSSCGSKEVDWQITTYQVAFRDTFPNLVFDCPITLLALKEVQEEVKKDLNLKTSDQSIVSEEEQVVTINGRNYSKFVAKE